jgi:hypothetical protein
MAWLNSRPTRDVIELIRRQALVDARAATSMSQDANANDIEIRTRLARVWMCEKILDLMEKLPDIKHEGNE